MLRIVLLLVAATIASCSSRQPLWPPLMLHGRDNGGDRRACVSGESSSECDAWHYEYRLVQQPGDPEGTGLFQIRRSNETLCAAATTPADETQPWNRCRPGNDTRWVTGCAGFYTTSYAIERGNQYGGKPIVGQACMQLGFDRGPFQHLGFDANASLPEYFGFCYYGGCYETPSTLFTTYNYYPNVTRWRTTMLQHDNPYFTARCDAADVMRISCGPPGGMIARLIDPAEPGNYDISRSLHLRVNRTAIAESYPFSVYVHNSSGRLIVRPYNATMPFGTVCGRRGSPEPRRVCEWLDLAWLPVRTMRWRVGEANQELWDGQYELDCSGAAGNLSAPCEIHPAGPGCTHADDVAYACIPEKNLRAKSFDGKRWIYLGTPVGDNGTVRLGIAPAWLHMSPVTDTTCLPPYSCHYPEYRNNWGRVCGTGPGVATAACRSLGYSALYRGREVRVARQADGPYYMTGVSCGAFASDLESCDFTFGDGDCDLPGDLAVVCERYVPWWLVVGPVVGGALVVGAVVAVVVWRRRAASPEAVESGGKTAAPRPVDMMPS